MRCSFGHKPQDAGASLLPLIDFAKRKVPERLWRTTPVVLAATGGVRLLAQEQADAVMASCLAELRTTPFRVDPANVRIISGVEEV